MRVHQLPSGVRRYVGRDVGCGGHGEFGLRRPGIRSRGPGSHEWVTHINGKTPPQPRRGPTVTTLERSPTPTVVPPRSPRSPERTYITRRRPRCLNATCFKYLCVCVSRA
eukprot:1904175-Prymnesium_polylepis.1